MEGEEGKRGRKGWKVRKEGVEGRKGWWEKKEGVEGEEGRGGGRGRKGWRERWREELRCGGWVGGRESRERGKRSIYRGEMHGRGAACSATVTHVTQAIEEELLLLLHNLFP